MSNIDVSKELDGELRKFLMRLVQMKEIPYRVTIEALKLHERITTR